MNAFIIIFILFSRSGVHASDAKYEPDVVADVLKRSPSGGAWAEEAPKMESLTKMDADTLFDEAFFTAAEVRAAMINNIKAKGIKSGDGKPLEDGEFVAEWLKVASVTVPPGDAAGALKKTEEFHALIKKYGVESAVRPATEGKECLWSGHVENSNYARNTDKMTPLETPPLMEVLSGTFGTEHFPKGCGGAGFKDRWLPNVCPMFNAATVVYSSNMKPTGGVLPVYSNQLKEWSAFFDAEINLFVPAGHITKIKMVILSPPPTAKKLFDFEVDVVKGDTRGTRDAVKNVFKALPADKVKILYDNDFDVALNDNEATYGSAESHPFLDASAGTRQKSKDCDKIYAGFFTNFAAKSQTKVAAPFSPNHFQWFYLPSAALLFIILLALAKYIFMGKEELNIVFDAESSGHYTQIAQI